jgi:hypothetical protein
MLSPFVFAVAVASASSSAPSTSGEPPADPTKMHPDPSPPVAAEPGKTIELWSDGCFVGWPSGGYARIDCPAELEGASIGSTFFREDDGKCYVHRGEEAMRRTAKCPDILVDKAQPGVTPSPTAGRAVRCGRCAASDVAGGEGTASAGALLVMVAAYARRARRVGAGRR